MLFCDQVKFDSIFFTALQCEEYIGLGVEAGGSIPDHAMRASSFKLQKPEMGRLNYEDPKGWVADSNEKEPWIEVNLIRMINISTIIMITLL